MITSPTRLHGEPPPVAESKGLEDTWSVWRMVPEVVRLRVCSKRYRTSQTQ